MGGFAWVTLATNDSYSLGALVLAHSLKRVGTQHDLAVLVTPGVTGPMREKLGAVFNIVREVNVLDSKDEANLAVLQRPELGITFTKLHCWRLTEYEKCVFVDADALVMKNSDELFEREELSAAPDVGWPDCFNSGVFVFKPSQETFASLTAFAVSKGSFDGADQGLLNMYFSDWAHKDISKHLPFIYNMCSTATYSYAPAFKQFGENVKIIHFIGTTKPWLQYFDTLTGIVQPPTGCSHLQPLLQVWWNIFCDNVHPQLTEVMGGLAGALSKLTLGESRTDEQQAIEDHMRKQNWEQGHIDFMGRDSFDNILKKINETLSTPPKRQPSPVKETRQPEKSDGKSSEVEAAVEECEVALPAIEELAKSIISQESSEVTCQKISSLDVTKAPSNNEHQQIKSSQDISEKDLQGTDLEETSSSLLQSTLVSEVQLQIQPEEKPTVLLSNLQEDSNKELADSTAPTAEIESIKQTESPSEISSVTDLVDSSTKSSSQEAVPVEPSEQITQVVSEATTECPVPIQVAESVLQAEPKESVSEDSRPVVEAVVSSITPSLRDSAAVVSETPIESGDSAPRPICPQQLNGDDPNLQSEVGRDTIPTATSTTTALISRSPNIVSVVHEFDPRTLRNQEAAQESQQAESQDKPEATQKLEEETANVSTESTDSTSEKTKLTVVLPVATEAEEVSTEPQITAESEILSADLASSEAPLRPNRSKDSKIPSTPIVIGPTPPTSPPLETESTQQPTKEVQGEVDIKLEETISSPSVEEQQSSAEEITQKQESYVQPEQSQEAQEEISSEKSTEPQKIEKKTKKIIKKSSVESDTPSSPESEGSSKKLGKKIVKKVKSKDGEAAEGSGTEKSKKPKTIKKASKTLSSSSLEADKSVPETPPPSASSEVPVPPKRKSKSGPSAKPADKKSDES